MAQVHVAVGVVLDGANNILLTRRADDAHQGGLWEFPGGKVEAGEPVLEALARELLEELGIDPVATEPLIEIHHDYGDKQVLLDVHVVTAFSGEPVPQEGQPMRWVQVAGLDDYDFPAANVPIVRVVQARWGLTA
ncbi:8-oxo-dGTP diphosphatase MutT [Haliea sp. E17]|uniref:8-oxo-dGTP diphosphatase MutT n=1 Tax=Haliea sp. E17 TaxID=3401576 RepID=UPI003AAA2229